MSQDLSEQALIIERTGLLEGSLEEFEWEASACY